MNKNVYVMMGVPGSGKSTWVRNNVSGAVVASADHYFEDEQGNYNFQPNKLFRAHESAFEKYLAALDDDKTENIVVDNTNTKLEFLRRYVLEANLRGYPVTMVVLKVDPDVASRRNVHGVPPETVKRMQGEIDNTLKIGFPSDWDIKEIIDVDNR